MALELDPADCLAPTAFLESTHPDVVAFAERAVGDAADDRERAVRLFHAVRDGIRYDPYVGTGPEAYPASQVVGTQRNWCVPKSVLLSAACRAVGIPAGLGFADVKNHLQSEKLRATMGTDLFAWHGYSVIFVDGSWHKVSSAFNEDLCRKFGTKVLEWDGTGDALMHAFDEAGNRHMEYVRDRGVYTDLPLDEILATFAELYAGMGTGEPGAGAAAAGDEIFQ